MNKEKLQFNSLTPILKINENKFYKKKNIITITFN
jgi:hypothetical protein